jgi:G3E family GTPase
MFIPQETDSRRLPVILLSGFLGSGKTTLVNALLKDPRLAETAVAINEFGAIPLDQHLIESGEDSTVVMANGCLCCNLSGDLEDAVMRVFSRRSRGELPSFRRLIVEPSGLADPAPIAQAILRNPVMSRALRFDGIVTVVDALFAEQQLRRHPETRKQVSLADHLVIAKSDLLENAAALEHVQSLLRERNPAAPIHVAKMGHVDAVALFPPGFLDHDAPWSAGIERFVETVSDNPHAAHGVSAICLTADRPLRWRAFDEWLREIRIAQSERLLRVKGLLHVAGAKGPLVIHGVHHVVHPPVELAAWPDSDRRTRIVLIVQDIAPSTIEARWRDALPTMIEPERTFACAL